MSGALRCATCGTEEPREGSRFCRACGASLAQSPVARSSDGILSSEPSRPQPSPANLALAFSPTQPATARKKEAPAPAPVAATSAREPLPSHPTIVDAPRAVSKTVPDQGPPPKRIAPTRFDPMPPSAPMPYRLSPAPPMPATYAPASMPAYAGGPPPPVELTFGGLVVRAILALGLSIGALFGANLAYEEVKVRASVWVTLTFGTDRATSLQLVGGAMVVTATLIVSLTVFLVSTRRRS